MNTEGGRISQIQQQAQRCAIEENLARARLFIGNGLPCKTIENIESKNIPTQSSYLSKKTNCYDYVTVPVVPESVRINRIQYNYGYYGTCYTQNTNTRFSDYAPKATIVVCPPITQSNGSVTNTCPLPNTPLNPVLGR